VPVVEKSGQVETVEFFRAGHGVCVVDGKTERYMKCDGEDHDGQFIDFQQDDGHSCTNEENAYRDCFYPGCNVMKLMNIR
jgi:hypothetical protein